MEINHALIAFYMSQGEMDVLHFCGFKTKPLWDDFESLAARLQTDPTYGLVGEPVGEEGYQITEAPASMVRFYKELNPADDDAYYVNESGAVIKM